MHDLERVMVEGWPPLERAQLGGWLLRAGAGFTGRANSVLPLGDPGVSLSEAIDHCESWYDERGLRRLFALFGPAGFAVDDDLLGLELLARGYQPFNNTVVLTAATRAPPSRVRQGEARGRPLVSMVGCMGRSEWPHRQCQHRAHQCRDPRGPGRDERLTGSALRLAGGRW